MKGKRMLVCLCVVMLGLYAGAAADGFDLEGMSEDELLALKEAVEQRFPTPAPQGIDLDAMDFDELTALRDAVVERLEPSVNEIQLDEGAMVLEAGKNSGQGKYTVGEDIPSGIWRLEPKPNGVEIIGIDDGETFIGYLLDRRSCPRKEKTEIPASCQYAIHYGGESVVVDIRDGTSVYVGSNGVIATPIEP